MTADADAERAGPSGPLAELATLLLAAAGGTVAGLASVVLYPRDWGLALLTVVCAAALLLIPAGLARAAAAGGWIGLVVYAGGGGPGGDVLVAQDVRAAFLAIDGLIFGGIAAATWPRKRHVRALSSSP